jgi:hypothetical protein
MTTYDDAIVGIDNLFPPLPAKVMHGYRWNGWAVPFFTLETVRVIAGAVSADLDDPTTVTLDDGGVWLRGQWEYEDPRGERIDPVMIDGVAHYGVGAMSWCWHEVDEA